MKKLLRNKAWGLLLLPAVLMMSSYKKNDVWSFAVISDTQGSHEIEDCINTPVLEKIAADIVKEKPEIVLVLGDLVNGWIRNYGKDYKDQYAEWKSLMKPVYDAKIEVYPIRGNHDDGPERFVLKPLPAKLEPKPGSLEKLRKAYRDAFKEYTYIPLNGPKGEEGYEYSFEHKNAFFIGMDLYNSGQHRVNQDWVANELAKNKQQHVFIYGHEPAFELIHADNLSYYPDERDLFWDTIGKAGCRLYFCGHDHVYNRSLIPDSSGNKIRQLVAGTGGGKLRKWDGVYKNKRVKGEYHNQDFHGYAIVTVDGAKVTVNWKALNESNGSWKLMDSFSYSSN
ncbi:MAG: metallophosphoesterase [Spirochaetia bacterium]|jgi:3',5'-cyclic AMP phosphodiesterase CpdA|nr:metallophosphoesterase [Spirochaetia bacterium]